MADFPGRIFLYGIGRGYVLSKATRIQPQQVDVAGSDINLVVGGQSEVSYAVVLQLIHAFNRLTLDGAQGDDLDRYALDRYGGQLPRKGAAAALVGLTFSRTNPLNASGTIPAGSVILAQGTSYQYVTLAPAGFTSNTGAPSDTTVTVNARAAQAGALFQAGANTLSRIQTPSQAIPFDTTITVTNPITATGGADAEDDPTYRNRIRTFWVNARRGILSAIQQGATSVPGVASALATEYISSTGQPVRLVALSIADSSGVANLQLTQTVQSVLNDYRGAGIQVVITPGIPLLQSIVIDPSFAAGTDTVTVAGLIQAAIVNYVNSLGVGQTLTQGALSSVLQRFVPQGLIFSAGPPSNLVVPQTIVSPVGDVVPPQGQTIRTTLALVSVA